MLNSHGLPRIEQLTPKQKKVWGEGTIVIPAPIEVNKEMQKVPKGKLTTINTIREVLAKKHRATISCPIVTGISANISAYAAEEERKDGKKRITPWWRTLKSNGELNEKFPGGINNQMRLLKAEGHGFILKGKRTLVQDWEKYLA